MVAKRHLRWVLGPWVRKSPFKTSTAIRVRAIWSKWGTNYRHVVWRKQQDRRHPGEHAESRNACEDAFITAASSQAARLRLAWGLEGWKSLGNCLDCNASASRNLNRSPLWTSLPLDCLLVGETAPPSPKRDESCLRPQARSGNCRDAMLWRLEALLLCAARDCARRPRWPPAAELWSTEAGASDSNRTRLCVAERQGRQQHRSARHESITRGRDRGHCERQAASTATAQIA